MHDREPETGDATSCAVLSILHWRCCRYPACVACGKFTELSILRWRCRYDVGVWYDYSYICTFQYSVGDALGVFILLSNMQFNINFQYSVGDAPLDDDLVQYLERRIFQYSVGDASSGASLPV